MVTTNATKTFLDWIHSTKFEDIPADVRHTTVLALYDDIGCNLACSLIPLAHRTTPTTLYPDVRIHLLAEADCRNRFGIVTLVSVVELFGWRSEIAGLHSTKLTIIRSRIKLSKGQGFVR